MKKAKVPGVRTVRTTMFDPPWPERGGGKIKRGADRHYQTLTPPEILGCLLTLQAQGIWRPHKDSHLYAWVTNNYFEAGIWLINNLGYRFIHPITWVKTKIGIGQYRRGITEHLLFAVRGKAQMPPKKGLPTTLLGGEPIPATEHSVKPGEQYADIEKVSPGPYLEIFARSVALGWDAHGKFAGEDTDPYLVRCGKNGRVTEYH